METKDYYTTYDTRAIPVGDNQILCRVLGKYKMFLDARDKAMMPYLAMDGVFEPHIIDMLRENIKPGMTAVDVGACFGLSTLVMADAVGVTGRVFAYEPHRRAFSMLKRNLEINGYSLRAAPCPDAVGDVEGDGTLAAHKFRYNAATLNEKAKKSFEGQDPFPVKVCTLDGRLGAIGMKPDFISLTCEGYEQKAWQGMKGILRESGMAQRKLTVFMRFMPKWYEDTEAFVNEIINDEGFRCVRIYENGMTEPLLNPEQFMGKYRLDVLMTR